MSQTLAQTVQPQGQTFLTQDPTTLAMLEGVKRFADTIFSILILGESGVGKELVMRLVHAMSSRRDGPYVVFDAGAFSAQLVEDELFGHVKGAFTGADRDRVGLFEQANGGTIAFDEIGNLPLEHQKTLLRTLQEKEVRRIGDGRIRPVDFRLCSATNADLMQRAEEGSFREDLIYRINTGTFTIPPLRDRPGDVALLATAFLKGLDGEPQLSDAALALLDDYSWPGNVRQLHGVLMVASVYSEGEAIGPEHIVLEQGADTSAEGEDEQKDALPDDDPRVVKLVVGEHSFQDAQRLFLERVFALHPEKKKSDVARMLGIHPPSFYPLLKKLGIE